MNMSDMLERLLVSIPILNAKVWQENAHLSVEACLTTCAQRHIHVKT